MRDLAAERGAEAESLRNLAAERGAEAESLRGLAAERGAEVESLRNLAAERGAEAESLRGLAAERGAEAESLRGRLKETEEKARLEIARVREQERRRTEEIEQAAEELRRLMREQAEQAQEQRRLDAARAAAIEDELSQTRRELSEAVSISGRLQAEAENLGRLRAEERSAYEKREMAAQEEARRAVARETELGALVAALEEKLAVARMQAGVGGAGADAVAPGGKTVDVDGGEAEYVEAEPLDTADVLKSGNKRKSAVAEAEILPPDAGAPERPGRLGHKTAAGAGTRPAAGLSMAALEAQARRELELLGSGAKMFFSKSKR